ncbi:P gene product [Kotonkan virus]|uniref:Polymerase-associated protein n=1 Tax=Kotonkan virus TaxID=318836 RepID=H8XWF1_9RHAB|nr:P gene product [Kotonkan virus]AEI17631.1 polymerase-associated protein [Kotonkan virus]
MEPYKLSEKMTGYDLVKLREVLNEVDDEPEDTKVDDVTQSPNPLFETSMKGNDSDEEWGEIISNMSNNVCSVNNIINKKSDNDAPEGRNDVIKKGRMASEESNSNLPLMWDNNWVMICDDISCEMSKAHSLLSLFCLKENVDYKFIVNEQTLTVQKLKFNSDDNPQEASGVTYKTANYSRFDEPEESSLKYKIHTRLDEGIKFKKLNGKGYIRVSWFTDGVYQNILDDIDWNNTKSEEEAVIRVLKSAKIYKMIKKTCEI